MREILSRIDKLMRGNFTAREHLQTGQVDVGARELAVAALPLGIVYGVSMGLYALMRGGTGGVLQMLASALKVPLLFLLTLVVTLPSLYVLSALARSRLTFQHTMRLLLAAVTINLALLASFGPVTAFFTLSTESYPFMVLLNVAFFAASGVVGLAFLRKALDVVFEPPSVSEPSQPLSPIRREQQQSAARVFQAWTLIYAIVGAQMGWILRPFVGAPNQPFQLFRARHANFFVAVWETLQRLF